MRLISQNDSSTRSFFVYTFEDTAQWIALTSGQIGPNSEWDWEPPPPAPYASGLYTVLIKRDPGGGSIMAANNAYSDDALYWDGYQLTWN
jgi:hypothetical protein